MIRSDVERTRAHIEEFRTDEARMNMEQMLTYYCKTEKITYKQGLNEVLGEEVQQFINLFSILTVTK